MKFHKEHKKDISKDQKEEAQNDQLNQQASASCECEDTITIKKSEYECMRKELECSKDSKDKILRLQADFDNIRKRLEREKQDFIKFANEGIVFELLNVVDDLERSTRLVSHSFGNESLTSSRWTMKEYSLRWCDPQTLEELW